MQVSHGVDVANHIDVGVVSAAVVRLFVTDDEDVGHVARAAWVVPSDCDDAVADVLDAKIRRSTGGRAGLSDGLNLLDWGLNAVVVN